MPTELIGVPYLDQYFGVWAIEERSFWAGFEFAKQMQLHVHLQQQNEARVRGADAVSGFNRVGQTAIIGLYGTLMKQESSMQQSTSTVIARRQVRAAARDPEIGAIMLHIDSPGGTVSGTGDLADDVAAANAVKPVFAYIEDLGASAAYWIASQATRIAVNPTSLVGSIGTYGVIYDYSGQAAMEGIKAYVVRAGKYKGAGTPGTEITQEYLAEAQRRVEQLNEHFLAGVAKGRKLTKARVAELADGRVHIGADAVSMGLADAVESFDKAFSRLQKEAKGRMKMTDLTPKAEDLEPIVAELAAGQTAQAVPAQKVAPAPVAQAPSAASYEEIKTACVGADATFIVAQLENKATTAQARDAWMREQNQRIDAANAKAAKPGVAPLASPPARKSGAQASGSATEQFWAEVAELQAAGMNRMRAISATVKKNPELHQSMLAEVNAKKSA